MSQPNDPNSDSDSGSNLNPAPSGIPEGKGEASPEQASPPAQIPGDAIAASANDKKPSKATSSSSLRLLRNRLVAGLFVVLPIFITYFVIKWLYDTLNAYVLSPLAKMFLAIWSRTPDGDEVKLHWIFEYVGAPGAAIALVLGILFVAGMFFRSRLHYTVDWVLSNVPGVSTVYNAVSNVVDALSRSQNGSENFKRVVLVPFPHPGMRVPAFVTSECTDMHTGRAILCVYVPTTPIPTSGYMILVPEDDVVEINWDIQETLQAIVSGGITVPETVIYDKAPAINITTTPKS